MRETRHIIDLNVQNPTGMLTHFYLFQILWYQDSILEEFISSYLNSQKKVWSE